MLSQVRADELVRSLSSVARKVFDAVPLAEEWTKPQIASELVRRSIGVDMNTTTGCLASLVRSGLVVEPVPGKFRRAPVRAPQEKPVDVESPDYWRNKGGNGPAFVALPDANPPPAPAPSKVDPLARLEQLAKRARLIGDELAQLADDIETAALEVSVQGEARSKELGRLRQLRDLLREEVAS